MRIVSGCRLPRILREARALLRDHHATRSLGIAVGLVTRLSLA